LLKIKVSKRLVNSKRTAMKRKAVGVFNEGLGEMFITMHESHKQLIIRSISTNIKITIVTLTKHKC
jgi:hypothetical protein